MSVEADFGRTDWLAQTAGTQLSWDITWPGVLEDGRFAAVSFQSDFVNAQLVRISESFTSDSHEHPHVGEVIRANSGFGPGSLVAFRFCVIVIPNH
jgi:hypothetical protein